MARCIDADKMLANICAECLDKGTDECKNGNCTERNWINNTPTEDVQPVVHGEWIKVYKDRFGNRIFRCSKCDFSYMHNEIFNYCPSCGARMAKV